MKNRVCCALLLISPCCSRSLRDTNNHCNSHWNQKKTFLWTASPQGLFEVQGHGTRKVWQISKIRPDQIWTLCCTLRIGGNLLAPIVKGGGDRLGKVQFSFRSPMIVTLTLDRIIRHIIVHHSSTSSYKVNFIEIGKKFLWTVGRTYWWIFQTSSNVITSTGRNRPKKSHTALKQNLTCVW